MLPGTGPIDQCCKVIYPGVFRGTIDDPISINLKAANPMQIDTAGKDKYFLSRKIDEFFLKVADTFRFNLKYFSELFRPPYEFPEIVRQCYKIGCNSLPL